MLWLYVGWTRYVVYLMFLSKAALVASSYLIVAVRSSPSGARSQSRAEWAAGLCGAVVGGEPDAGGSAKAREPGEVPPFLSPAPTLHAPTGLPPAFSQRDDALLRRPR